MDAYAKVTWPIAGASGSPASVPWRRRHAGGGEVVRRSRKAQGMARAMCEAGIDELSLLKACARLGDLARGARIHAHLLKTGRLDHGCAYYYLANALISLYARCGAFSRAMQVFEQMHHARDVVSWNALIAGYAGRGHAMEALEHFARMQREGCICPDAFTFASVLKACAMAQALDTGEQVHAEIIKHRLLDKDIFIGAALVDMYAKCGDLAKAADVFDRLPFRNVVSWNALISGCSKLGRPALALERFVGMQRDGFCPNPVTFVCALNSCARIESLEKGKCIHAQIIRQSPLEKNALVGNALVDMYAKCGMIARARRVFDGVLARDAVTWNVLIAGYVKSGHGEEAIHSFERMQRDGFSPDSITFLCILKVCGSMGAVHKGKEVHSEIVREGLVDKEVAIGNALVDMYAKCSGPMKAQEVFDRLRFRDVVSWNSLIAGYAHHGCAETALECFQQMQGEGLAANKVTFLCILKACGCLGAIHAGEDIHAELRREKLFPEDILISTTLVDMYAKCGALGKAHRVFDQIQNRNVISWNALMAGYGQLGNDTKVVELFNEMIREGMEADLASLTIVLNVCNHSGRVDEGQTCIEMISTSYSIVPSVVHHVCMVDLLVRAGNFGIAVEMIERLPLSDHLPVWISLLGACKKWHNVKLGQLAFDNVVRLKEDHASAYVCMRNIYSMQEEQDNAKQEESAIL